MVQTPAVACALQCIHHMNRMNSDDSTINIVPGINIITTIITIYLLTYYHHHHLTWRCCRVMRTGGCSNWSSLVQLSTARDRTLDATRALYHKNPTFTFSFSFASKTCYWRHRDYCTRSCQCMKRHGLSVMYACVMLINVPVASVTSICFHVSWRHQSRDHSILHISFPIAGPLETVFEIFASKYI